MTTNETAAALAVELTIITGEIWRIIPDPDTYNQRPQIYSPSAYLHILMNWNKRLSISASTPRGMKSKTTAQSITCNPNRTPEAIAKDIAVRLLPHAREYLEESQIFDHEKRKEEAIQNLKNKMIKKYLPHEWHSRGNTAHFTNEYDKTPDAPAVTAYRDYDGLIKIETKLQIKPALELLKQLTKEN